MDQQNSLKPVRLFCDTVESEKCDYSLPPIILLHGLSAIHTTWNKVKNEIAAHTRRQVFCVDLRNHGQSEWSNVSSMKAMILDLELFFSIRNIQKAILIGHSLGGRLAAAFALKQPEKVVALIAEDAILSNPTKEEISQFLNALNSLKRLRLLPKDVSEKDVQKLFVRVVEASFPHQKILNKDAVMVPFHRGADGRFQYDFNIDVLERAMEDRSLVLFDSFQPVNVPALFLYGEHSTSRTKDDEMIPECFPKAKLQCMERCAHMCHLEEPDDFAKIVCSFIKGSC